MIITLTCSFLTTWIYSSRGVPCYYPGIKYPEGNEEHKTTKDRVLGQPGYPVSRFSLIFIALLGFVIYSVALKLPSGFARNG